MTRTIGVITSSFEGSCVIWRPYAGGITAGILAAAAEHNCNVDLITRAWTTREASWPRCAGSRADGFILIAPPMESDVVATLVEEGVPAAGVSTAAEGIPTIDVDDDLGTTMAAEHLIGLGHREIAHLGGNMSQSSGLIRRNAFLRTMERNGLRVPDHFVIETGFFTGPAYLSSLKLLREPRRPSAIVAANDAIAYGVLRAASELLIPIPEALSVVGYDDEPSSQTTTPPLTTIRQPLEEMGRLAVKLLVDRLSGKNVEARHYLLPTEIVVRASTTIAPLRCRT
ncbi:MAG: LacI family DNA-binding transcriptional regulator [Capsulimonadaceae bacterium]